MSGIDFSSYQHRVSLLFWLLGPATVALAIPLYHQAGNIRRHTIAIFLTTILGGSAAVAIALAGAWLLGADTAVLQSLASKSITTPIALSLTDVLGGIPQLAAGAVIITGRHGRPYRPANARPSRHHRQQGDRFYPGLDRPRHWHCSSVRYRSPGRRLRQPRHGPDRNVDSFYVTANTWLVPLQGVRGFCFTL